MKSYRVADCDIYSYDLNSLLPQQLVTSNSICCLTRLALSNKLRELGLNSDKTTNDYIRVMDPFLATIFLEATTLQMLEGLKGINIFCPSTKYWLIPCCRSSLGDNHWLVLVLINGFYRRESSQIGDKTLQASTQCQMIVMDSLPSKGTMMAAKMASQLSTMAQKYWGLKVAISISEDTNLPRQNNSFDCGVYTIAFIESFLSQRLQELIHSEHQRNNKRLKNIFDSVLQREKYWNQLKQEMMRQGLE